MTSRHVPENATDEAAKSTDIFKQNSTDAATSNVAKEM